MKVLIIPEDPTHDQYILKPIVERLFAQLGRSARIQVLWNPRLRSVEQALDPKNLEEIVDDHPMIDLFLVMVDRDGDQERRPAQARNRETTFEGRLLVCLAIEEVEVWMLALHRDAIAERWREIRSEPHPKERFADPFLEAHAPRPAPGGGRKWAMRELAGQWQGLLRLCEELAELERRIASLPGNS